VVEYRYTVSTFDGLLEAAKIRCPLGHWFSAPIEVLTWPRHPAPTQTHQRRAA
jgi:hypothetical protein